MAQEIDFSVLHKAAYQTMLARIDPQIAAGLTNKDRLNESPEVRELEYKLMAESALLMIEKTGGHVSIDDKFRVSGNIIQGQADAQRIIREAHKSKTKQNAKERSFSAKDMQERVTSAVISAFSQQDYPTVHKAYISAFEDGLDKVLLQKAQGITKMQLTEHERSVLKWLASHQQDPDVVSQPSEPSEYRINVKSLLPTQAEELYLALKDAGVENILKGFNWQHPEQDSNPCIIADKQEVGRALTRGIPHR